MIPASAYALIVLIIEILGTLYCVQLYGGYSWSRVADCNRSISNNNGTLLLTVALIFFIGLRPIAYEFVDTMNYYWFYMQRYYSSVPFTFSWDVKNILFDNIMMLMATLKFDVSLFFLLIACIYYSCIYISIKKIFPNDIAYALFVYLAAFSTFSYATNGIKAGAAASIFLLIFAYYRKPMYSILVCILSIWFHHSMYFPITAFAISYFFKRPKYYFYFWGLCFAIAALHITYFQFLFAGLSEGSSGYLGTTDLSDTGMKSGFRIDFILYGFPPILIGYWVVIKKKIIDRTYQLLLCTYLLTNAIWMLTMYAPFNNRIAYLSWFILPIVTIYPFLKFKLCPNQYKYLNYITLIYLIFKIYAHIYL